MRILCLSLILLLSCSPGANSQDAQHYPAMQPGDTLFRAIDVLPEAPTVSSEMGELFWNYSRLMAPFIHQLVVMSPGRLANVFERQPDVRIQMIEGHELFLRNDHRGVWVSGIMFSAIDRQWLAVADDNFPWRYEALDLGETATFEGRLDILALRNGAQNGEQPTVDSDVQRFQMAYTIEIRAEDRGIIKMPRGQYEAVQHRMSFKFAAIGLDNNGPEYAPLIRTELPELLMAHTNIVFWSNLYPDPVVVSSTDLSGNPRHVDYRRLPFGVPVYPGQATQKDVYVYPNPSYGHVRFDFVNLPRDTYALEIYNILGVRLRTETVTIQGSKTVPFDLSDLRKGTYIYRLVDSARNNITSKRLVIVNP